MGGPTREMKIARGTSGGDHDRSFQGSHRAPFPLIQQLRTRLGESGGSVTALQIPDAIASGARRVGLRFQALPLMAR